LARHRRAVKDQPVLEKLFTAKVLKIGVLNPQSAQAFVRQIVHMLEDRNPHLRSLSNDPSDRRNLGLLRHQPRRQRRVNRSVRIGRPEYALKMRPVDLLSQQNQWVPKVDNLIKA
jgi:hypothetical protein